MIIDGEGICRILMMMMMMMKEGNIMGLLACFFIFLSMWLILVTKIWDVRGGGFCLLFCGSWQHIHGGGVLAFCLGETRYTHTESHTVHRHHAFWSFILLFFLSPFLFWQMFLFGKAN
jgi:hypothetical protein